eukprot:496256_1
MTALFLIHIIWSSFIYAPCYGAMYVLSDEMIRIISESDTCNIGKVEINDHSEGWTSITTRSNCSDSTQNGFSNNLGNIICKQLGFSTLKSYQMVEATQSDEMGYNRFNCASGATNICTQCELEHDTDCEEQRMLVECEGSNTDEHLECILLSDYLYVEEDSEYECNVSSNLAKKPFYEDETFILVMVIIGLVVTFCFVICVMNWCQEEYNECMGCRSCIRCLLCKCLGYEGGDNDPVPFDVSKKRKADLARRQQGRAGNEADYW